jgi:hypothetical protein
VTTPEERRLAALLHGEADTIDAGDGALDTIRSGVRRRRTRRRVALSGAAAVVTGALVATVALGGGAGTNALDPEPPASSAPSAPATATATPTATALPADPDGSTTSKPGTPFFPFTSDAQAAAWGEDPSTKPWADDPVKVAQHLVDDLLGLKNLKAEQYGDGNEITLRVGGFEGETVAEVVYAQLGTGANRPYVVLAVTSADAGRPLRITTPTAGAEVTSPLQVSGTIPGVDENVRVTLRTVLGTKLDEEGAPAGSEQPWSASLQWSAETWTTGVVSAQTFSPRDGEVTRVAAVPVLRDPSPRTSVPSATDAFVGEVDGKVGLYSATDGRLLKPVSFPPVGNSDTSPRRSGSKVLWLRLGSDCAGRSLIQRDLATDVTTTLVAGQPLVTGSLAVSPDGRWTAWALRPGCESGPTTIVVQGPDGIREIDHGDTSGVGSLDLRDDGALLVDVTGEDGGMVEVFPPASPNAQAMDAETDCLLYNGAFLGSGVVATEQCDPFGSPPPLRRVELALSGNRSSTTPTTLTDVVRLATAGDAVLVQDGDGTIGRLEGGRFVPVLRQSACAETLEARGCLTDIDW